MEGDLREQASARIEDLRREFEAGQSRLNQLEMEEARLRETLLRISGAIQVLQEPMVPLGVGDSEQQVGQQRVNTAADKAGHAIGPECEGVPATHAAGTGVIDIFVGPS